MIKTITINKIHLYPGIHSGLSTKTAIVKMTYSGKSDSNEAMQTIFEKKFKALAPADDYYINLSQDWKRNFLFLDAKKQVDKESGYFYWIIALATAIQLWARDPVWKGRVILDSNGSAILALPWERKDIFKEALVFALKYLSFWFNPRLDNSALDKLSNEYQNWLPRAQKGGLAPNTLRFALAAMHRSIPVTVQTSQIRLGSGRNAIRMNSSFTDHTSVIAAQTAKNKLNTNILMRQSLVPAPAAALAPSYQQALEIVKLIPFPVVIKPISQDQGIGISTNIKNNDELYKAFHLAKKYSQQGVIVEKHMQGDDHRMLVVKGKLLVSAKRIPGGVTGDGKSSIEELVRHLNDDPRRGNHRRSLMKYIELDDEADGLMREQKFTVESIPHRGQFVKLRHTANLSSGGTAIDVTKIVHPDNHYIAEHAAQLVGLDIAGVDFICPDISQSWKKIGGAVIEVNAQPGFRPHWLSLPERDVNGEVLDSLFRDNPARIPVAAITGTNGKTTTAKMLHQIWMSSGKNAGVATTNGVWIGTNMISNDNLSGNPGGRIILNDPTVEAAIIEMPRKGLIIFGHPTDQYNVAALLNIQNDHIGADGINSPEEMLTLKSEVLHRAQQAVVINAEDSLCLKAAKNIGEQKLILISTDEALLPFRNHTKNGGAGVFIKTVNAVPWIILIEKNIETPLITVFEIPATIGGLAVFNTKNAMFAAGLAWAQNIPYHAIRTGLSDFKSSMEQNPGRMNFIEGFPFKLLLDFSHNPDTVENLTQVIDQISVKGRKIVVIQTIGNRHRSHLRKCAPELTKTFDEFILSCIPERIMQNPEWNSIADPISAMLYESQASILTEKVPKDTVRIESDQVESIKLGLKSAKPGDLLVVLAGANIAIPIINAALQEKFR